MPMPAIWGRMGSLERRAMGVIKPAPPPQPPPPPSPPPRVPRPPAPSGRGAPPPSQGTDEHGRTQTDTDRKTDARGGLGAPLSRSGWARGGRTGEGPGERAKAGAVPSFSVLPPL